MKSTASSSKRTLLRKNLTRFAPLWGMYLLCLLLGLFMLASDNSPEYWLAHSMAALIKTMPPINAGYALLAALVLFGDLFNSRMCNALHAMPVKRGTFYAANLKAGLLFSLVPTAVMAVIAGVLLNAYCVVVTHGSLPRCGGWAPICNTCSSSALRFSASCSAAAASPPPCSTECSTSAPCWPFS